MSSPQSGTPRRLGRHTILSHGGSEPISQRGGKFPRAVKGLLGYNYGPNCLRARSAAQRQGRCVAKLLQKERGLERHSSCPATLSSRGQSFPAALKGGRLITLFVPSLLHWGGAACSGDGALAPLTPSLRRPRAGL